MGMYKHLSNEDARVKFVTNFEYGDKITYGTKEEVRTVTSIGQYSFEMDHRLTYNFNENDWISFKKEERTDMTVSKETFVYTLEEILKQIDDIEKYEGEAYQMFDEIGRAIHEIKVIAKRNIWDYS